jgi:CRISPR-associated endonuclease/helicase Cas3
MFASTWMFRGYASSPGVRSVDAAHAGLDAVILLDEAHLSQALRDLADPLAQCDAGDPSSLLGPTRSRSQIISLTATGDAKDPFVLNEADHQNPVVQMRLNAAKPTSLIEVPSDSAGVATHLTRAALDALHDRAPSSTVVFVNTARGARQVFDALSEARTKRGSPIAGADLVLLTGRMRNREADRARTTLLDPESGAPSSRDHTIPRTRHLVAVATQTLEVGADLDFDVLITESCGTRALVQRLGRLNRLGLTPNACAVVVHPSKSKEWPLYGMEPAEVWNALKAAQEASDLPVNLSPAALPQVLGPPSDHPVRTAEILPAHLWQWVKTTVAPPGEPPVEPFFEGFATEGPRVTLCWRATSFGDGDRLLPSVHNDEVVELPLFEARSTLGEALGEKASIKRLSRDRVTVESCTPAALRPGDIAVLSTSDGMYDDHGWSPSSRATVLDLSLPHWPGLPLEAGMPTLRSWVESGEVVSELVREVAPLFDERSDDVDRSEMGARALSLVADLLPKPEFDGEWAAFAGSLLPTIDDASWPPVLKRAPSANTFRQSQLIAADAFDDLSANVKSVALDDHLASVGEIARTIGDAIGLPEDLVAAVEAAARFHDLGKAEPRFQRWLDPHGTAGVPLAKSSTPRRGWRTQRESSGWPSGGRHEALSARLLQQAWSTESPPSDHNDLVIHLVLSHHGFARPLVTPVDDPTATAFSAMVDGTPTTCSGALDEVDWDQPARFQRCCEAYGYWGLALLEAIVRQADHLASSHSAAQTVEVA